MRLLENSRNGIQIQDKVIDLLKKKVSNYEVFLNSNIEDLVSQSQDHSIFDKFSTSQDAETPDASSISPLGSRIIGNNFKSMTKAGNGQQYSALNFDEINKTFTQGRNENIICALLQALRWRITR